MEMSSDADQNLLPSTAWVLGKLQHELDPSYQHLSDGHTAATQPLALLEAAEQAAVVLTLETYRDWRQTQALILQNRGIDPHESSKNPLYKNALLLLWKSLLTTLLEGRESCQTLRGPRSGSWVTTAGPRSLRFCGSGSNRLARGG